MDKIQNNAMLLTAKITKFSNTRRDNGMAGIDKYLQTKAVWVNYG